MIIDSKKIILDILQIIDFNSDKLSYAYDLIKFSQLKALKNLINTLPEKQRDMYSDKLKQAIDQNQIIKEFETIFPKSKREKFFQIEFEKIFEGFLKAIVPTLNENKKKELEEYLDSLTSNQFRR